MVRSTNADQALHELRRADRLLDVMTVGFGRIFNPRLRRLLMALKDEIKTALADAAANVKGMQDAQAALRADSKAKQDAITTLEQRIAELQAMPGAWDQSDIDEIRGGIASLKAAFNPEATVAAVFANTDTSGNAGGTGGQPVGG